MLLFHSLTAELLVTGGDPVSDHEIVLLCIERWQERKDAKEGRKEGREIGREEGRKERREEGRKEGEKRIETEER